MSEVNIHTNTWRFVHFGLFVTGDGESHFMPSFLRSLAVKGNCHFEVIRKVNQRSPITSERRIAKMVGTGKLLPNRDAKEIGLPARRYLHEKQDAYVILLDDLEHDRRVNHALVFDRYSTIFDNILPSEMRHRASVHFLVNMIEAYFMADPCSIAECLNVSVDDVSGDVETIQHPKNDLKRQCPGYDEVEDGACIAARMDVATVLSDPKTCRSLRGLFKWCSVAKGDSLTDEFQLAHGECHPITASQIATLK